MFPDSGSHAVVQMPSSARTSGDISLEVVGIVDQTSVELAPDLGNSRATVS